ncbi:MAG: hypothetical protein QM731_28045 [Chitinophagaceae bacterium]
MRIGHRYLTFDKNEKLTKLLDKLEIKYKVQEKHYDPSTYFYALEFHLYEDDPKFIERKKAVDKFKIRTQVGTFYEKGDYDNAEWFVITTGEYQYPQPEEGYKDATFNLENYCQFCGIGKIQNAPYRLQTQPKQLNNQFWGLHWEFEAIFVRQGAKNILEQEKIKGIRFSNPVLHRTNSPIEGFYQLHIDTILNKGFDNYNTQTITCKINNEEGLNTNKKTTCCGRIKFHHPMIGGYLFDRTLFKKDLDIVESNEYFGSGGAAYRLQIVSKRFKEIVDKNKLKGLSFIPIMHNRLNR